VRSRSTGGQFSRRMVHARIVPSMTRSGPVERSPMSATRRAGTRALRIDRRAQRSRRIGSPTSRADRRRAHRGGPDAPLRARRLRRPRARSGLGGRSVLGTGPIRFRERLAGFKCPTTVDWVDALPRNPSGKVLKRERREPFWEGHDRRVSWPTTIPCTFRRAGRDETYIFRRWGGRSPVLWRIRRAGRDGTYIFRGDWGGRI
jgi:hypothetical protein